MKDILSTLAGSGRHRTIHALLAQSQLAETLNGPGPITLFAPCDAAFERIKIETVTKDPEYLAALLDYHVLEGKYSSEEIAQQLELATVGGKALTVQLEEGEQVIDNARYEGRDIACSNGVIHSMDNVFLPQFSGWYD